MSEQLQEWHPCEHCKQFEKSVQILDSQSYVVGTAQDWESAKSIAEVHNAALDAERERSKELGEDCEHYSELAIKREQQLAAEREKGFEECRQLWVRDVANRESAHNAALAAAETEWQWDKLPSVAAILQERDKLRQQLVAAREKAKGLEKSLLAIRNHTEGHNRNACLGCSFSFNTAANALVKVKE